MENESKNISSVTVDLILFYCQNSLRIKEHTHTHTPLYFKDVIFQAFCVTFRLKVRASLVLLAGPQLRVSH